MRKLYFLIGVAFLCSCSRQESFILLPSTPSFNNKLTHEIDFEYKNENASLNTSYDSAFDARGIEIKNFVPGDVLDLFYAEDINNIEYKFIHKAYILELDKVNNNYYSPLIEQNIDLFHVEYCILDEEYHYVVNENLEYNKIYVSISEDDFVNKNYKVKGIYTFNPRKDNTLVIKNITYDKSSSNPIYKSAELLNKELVSQVTLYYNDTSSSHTHKIKRIELENDQLYIFVDNNYPEIGDCAMAYWTINIEFEKISNTDAKINIRGY